MGYPFVEEAQVGERPVEARKDAGSTPAFDTIYAVVAQWYGTLSPARTPPVRFRLTALVSTYRPLAQRLVPQPYKLAMLVRLQRGRCGGRIFSLPGL